MHDEFLKRVEGFLKSSGMLPTDFGKYALKNPSFVFRLRKGRSCSLKTAEKVLTFMEANKDYRMPKVVLPKTILTEGNHEATAEIAAQ